MKFKQWFNEASSDDVRAIFQGLEKGTREYVPQLHVKAAMLADYLEEKGNHTKANLIRSYLENPDHAENIELLYNLADSALEGFASPYINNKPEKTMNDGNPYIVARIRVNNLEDAFDIPPHERELIRTATAHMPAPQMGANISLTIPVTKEIVNMAKDAHMSIRQLLTENPELLPRLFDYNNMKLNYIRPIIQPMHALHHHIPNIEEYIEMTPQAIRRLTPLIERQIIRPGSSMPVISNDLENYTNVLWDLRRGM
ncbi:MAG: hypothetical protein RLZZ446_502 [Bacteroidota bacterium]|jgi:hypothetical protein